jgi:hypothetical protein
MPCGRNGEAANTGSPAIPSSKYKIWLAAPNRDPSAAAPTRTIIGCSVNGTGVNGRCTLTCAAAAVNAVRNSIDAIRMLVQAADDAAPTLT